MLQKSRVESSPLTKNTNSWGFRFLNLVVLGIGSTGCSRLLWKDCNSGPRHDKISAWDSGEGLADSEQGHLTTAPPSSSSKCCCQRSCFAFYACCSFSDALQKARSACLPPAAPSALAAGRLPSAAPNIKETLQLRNPLSDPVPPPRRHKYNGGEVPQSMPPSLASPRFVSPGQSLQSAVRSQ